MRGLFYCSYTLGVGHLFRSLNICQSLVEISEIDFIQGGIEIGRTVDSPVFQKITLPPFDEKSSYADQLFNRHQVLEEKLKDSYDFLITEMFPFGKRYLADEVVGVIKKLKNENPKCRIIASIRDILDPDQMGEQKGALEVFNRWYDALLVHGDSDWIKLEESFPEARNLKGKIHYTGYEAPFFLVPNIPKERLNQILIMAGGGFECHELYLFVGRCAHLFPDYTFLFVMGPKGDPKTEKDLINLAQENIKIIPFQENIEEEMVRSKLAIVRPSSSTCVHLVRTKTKALFYPYIESESQPRKELLIRGEFFAEKGVGIMVTPGDFSERVIKEALESPFPKVTLNCSGAENTKQIVLAIS